MTPARMQTARIASVSRPAGDDAAVVYLDGELDICTTARIEPRLRERARDGRDLVLDLSAVTFCDSAGINLFLRLNRLRATATGLSLRGVPRQPARVIRLLGLDRVIACAFDEAPFPDLVAIPRATRTRGHRAGRR